MVNLPLFASRSTKHSLPLPAPGSVVACSPPPVQSWTFFALSYTHLRVRSDPHAFAASANSSHDDHACAPSSALALAFGLYCSNASRYCWVGGFFAACSNGMNELGM